MAKTKANRQQDNRVVFGIIGAVVAVAVIAILVNFLGIGGTAVDVDYSKIPVTKTEDGAFVAGDPAAPFTLVAFEDYRCSACISYEPTLARFMKDYVETGKAKFEFRMLQTASPDDAIFRIAQCAGDQNPEKFFEYREELFNMTSRGWSATTSPRDFASKFGLNYADILECTSDVTQVATDAQLATAVGVTGTPFIFYRTGDSDLLPMQAGQAPSYDQLKAFVDTVLLVQ